MKKFKLEIDLENDAMLNEKHVASALKDVVRKLQLYGLTSGVIMDINGNCVGNFWTSESSTAKVEVPKD